VNYVRFINISQYFDRFPTRRKLIENVNTLLDEFCFETKAQFRKKNQCDSLLRPSSLSFDDDYAPQKKSIFFIHTECWWVNTTRGQIDYTH
jgi:hypothetical protein